LKVECLKLKVVWIPAFGTPIWHSLRRTLVRSYHYSTFYFTQRRKEIKALSRETSTLHLCALAPLREILLPLTSNSRMEWVWIILGIILCIIGIIGSLLPLLPGPPIAYAGILLQLFRNPDPFESKTYWIFAGIVVVSLVLDYLIPIWGTKKFGGTKYGAWGCTLGFLASILDRAMGCYHRAICRRFYRRNDWWAGFA
jgi:hypothetical protein